MSDRMAHVPILQIPRGMISSLPGISIPDGYVTWAENYNLSEGGYKSRRGFDKYNRYAIPFSGMRLDGSTQYLEVLKANSADGQAIFAFDATSNWVLSVAFMLEDFTMTVDRRAIIAAFGVSASGEAASHFWALELYRQAAGGVADVDRFVTQARFRVGATTMETAFTAVGDGIKSGVGYRIVVVKDVANNDGDHAQMYLFRQGTALPIANITGASMTNKDSQGRLYIGRGFNSDLSGGDGFFPGVIQDLRFWHYGASAPDVFVDPSTPTVVDPAVVRADVELNTVEVADSTLKLYLKMEDNNNESGIVEDGSGEDYDALMRPGPPVWTTPGLVDSAPVTYCLNLNPIDKQYLRIKDRPTALGGSLFRHFGQNTNYEFTFSIAFEIDLAYIERLEAGSAAPAVLPLAYYGDDSSAGVFLGDDYSVAGNWGFALELYNAGSVTVSDYRVRVSVNGENHGYIQTGPSAVEVVLGTKYRVDIVRSGGQYIWYRIYKDGEEHYAGEGDERKILIQNPGVNDWASEPLDDPVTPGWSNGAVFLIGTLNYNDATQYYFPGKIDDIRIYSRNAEEIVTEGNITQHTWDRIGVNSNDLLFYGPLNEGKGYYVTDHSSWNNNLASSTADHGELHELKPTGGEPDFGAGWVKPNRYNKAVGLTVHKDIENGEETVFVLAGAAIWGCPAKAEASLDRFGVMYHGLKGEQQMSTAHLNNQIIWANGVNENLRYDGKSLDQLGIGTPGTAPGIASVGSGSILDGTYIHYYRWVNSKTGGGGNLSPGTTTVLSAGPNNARVAFYAPTVGTDVGALSIDTVEIWRTKASGALPYYVGEVKLPERAGSIAVAGGVMPTYTDSTADANLGVTTMSSIVAYSPMPICKYVISAKSRLFGLAPVGHPNRFIWSEIHFPDHHDPTKRYNDELDAGDGDEITGGIFWNDTLWIFQRRHIWSVIGVENENTMILVHRFSGVGCVAHETIAVVGGFLVWRGEENFFRLTAGSSSPEPIGNPVKDLLELADPTQARYETSGVLRQEGIYLCAVTSEIGRAVTSTTRNDYIFAYDVYHQSWSLWSLPGLASFANIELGGFSELFALLRNGFVLRYSGLGKDDSTAGIRQHTYMDGMARGKRSWFTLSVAASDDDEYVTVLETTNVDADEDGMKGLQIRFQTADGSISSIYYIRKVVEYSSKYRIYLTAPLADGDLSIGSEVYVGGFTRKITTRLEHFGRPSAEKIISGLYFHAAANSATPMPQRAPTVEEATGAVELVYAYTYEVDSVEGLISGWTTATGTRVGTYVEMYGPNTDLGTTVKVNLYLMITSAGSHAFRKIVATTVTKPGEIVRVADPNTYIAGPVLYDPEVGASLITVTASKGIRGRSIAEAHSDLRLDLSGDAEWRFPTDMAGNMFQFTLEAPYPNTNHEIHVLMGLLRQ